MDPLSPSNINAGWASSPPETPTSAQPSSSSAQSSTFRDPRVYGAPGTGLVNPPTDRAVDVNASPSSRTSGVNRANGANGDGGEDKKDDRAPFLRVRIGGLERNRKDLLIRFDASTNLPNFRTTLYKNMQRSYAEFVRFAEQAQLTSPHTIIAALPLPSTSAVTDEEDDRLVRIGLQRWFTRICEDPVMMRDDELREFIESDFNYNPVPPPAARRTTSASSATGVFSAALSKVVRRGPMDEDEELASAKGALEKLEGNWGAAAAHIGTLGKARRAHALANQDVGARLISLSTVEPDLNLSAAERKFGRTLEQLAAMAGAQAASENVVLSDSLGYQALNARAAKDALAQRTQILEDSHAASKAAINKRRNVERLKGSSSINPAKVDDAISEMDEANELENQLSRRLQAISQNLHVALRAHSKNAHEDVALALLENARLSIGYHKHALRELEALRPDIGRIGTDGVPPPPIVKSPKAQGRGPAYAPPAVSGPTTPTRSNPPTMGSRNYASPPRTQHVPDVTQSMFISPPQVQSAQPPAPILPPHTANPSMGSRDPLAGAAAAQAGHPQQYAPMAQSMVLPGQAAYPGQPIYPGHPGQPIHPGHPGHPGRQTQANGRGGTRRLDERQAAKLLAGGF